MKMSFILLEDVTDANTEEERNRVEKSPVPKQKFVYLLIPELI